VNAVAVGPTAGVYPAIRAAPSRSEALNRFGNAMLARITHKAHGRGLSNREAVAAGEFGANGNKLLAEVGATPADGALPNDSDGVIRSLPFSISDLVGLDVATAEVATGHRIHLPAGNLLRPLASGATRSGSVKYSARPAAVATSATAKNTLGRSRSRVNQRAGSSFI
jgi:hypothetical protein